MIRKLVVASVLSVAVAVTAAAPEPITITAELTGQQKAALARVALAAPGRTLPVLPHGSVRADVIDEAQTGGRKLTLVALFGLLQQPLHLWLDEQQELAATHEWNNTIDALEAFRPHTSLLRERHRVAVERWRGEVVKRLERRPGKLAVTNARLFDPESGRVAARTTIVVQENRIVAVGTKVAIPPDAERIDAGGRVVTPGLWDMHRHIGADDLLFDLAAGVTAIRDLGADAAGVAAVRRDVEAGRRIGPRIFVAGLLFSRGGGGPPVVKTPEEVAERIATYVTGGADQIKVYGGLDPALLDDVIEHAHARGRRVSGHIPAGMVASQAIALGLDEIHHMNQVMLNFMPDVKATDTLLRFTAVGERGARLDLESKEVRSFIRELKKRGTVVDPTVGIFERVFATRAGNAAPLAARARALMPVQLYRLFERNPSIEVSARDFPRYQAAYRKMLTLIGALHRGGVTLVAGTDGPAGLGLHRELELYVEAGLSPRDALRTATSHPARHMRRSDLGRVAPGMLADFVIFDGDPTRNISDVRRVRTVVKDGAIYDPAELYREMGVAAR